MKNVRLFIKLFLLAVITLTAQQNLFAGVPYKLDTESSSVIVTGTSSLHDWEMDVEELTGSIELAEENSLNAVSSANLTIEVESIVGEYKLMNKKTREALKDDDYPQITMKLVKAEGGTAQVELSIAGMTKTLSDDYKIDELGDGKFSVQGELDVKLSDFEIEPPVAMLGTIKTGNDVVVKYKLVYQK